MSCELLVVGRGSLLVVAVPRARAVRHEAPVTFHGQFVCVCAYDEVLIAAYRTSVCVMLMLRDTRRPT